MSDTQKPKLEPPDPLQCQALKSNGVTFLTLGGRPEMVRCTEKPTVIITEAKPGEDGLRGSMSLCDECALVMMRQLGPSHGIMAPIFAEPEFSIEDEDEIEKTRRSYLEPNESTGACVEVATLIVTSLLTVPSYPGPSNSVGTRLQIMKRRPNGSEESLGGWIKDSAIRDVTKVLIAFVKKKNLTTDDHDE